MNTTQELLKTLNEYRIALIKNGKPPSELGFSFDSFIRRIDEFNVPKEARIGAKFYQNMQSAGLNVDIIFAYHEFRDHVQNYQIANDISSIIEEEIVLFGEKFSYKKNDDQLFLLDNDRLILCSEVSRIVNFFLKAVSQYEYILIKTEDDEDCGTFVVPQQILDAATNSQNAWLSQSSWEIENENTFVLADKILPDEIWLFLDYGKFVFTALRPDTNIEWIEKIKNND